MGNKTKDVIKRSASLGHRLIERGLLTEEKLAAALQEQEVTKERLGTILVRYWAQGL